MSSDYPKRAKGTPSYYAAPAGEKRRDSLSGRAGMLANGNPSLVAGGVATGTNTPVSGALVPVIPESGWVSDTLTTSDGTYELSVSSQFGEAFPARNIFNGLPSSWVSASENVFFWLAVRLPTSVSVHEFDVAGRLDTLEDQSTVWRLEGRSGAGVWQTVYDSNGPLTPNPVRLVLPSPSAAYSEFRLFTVLSTGTNPGLGRLQLYTR